MLHKIGFLSLLLSGTITLTSVSKSSRLSPDNTYRNPGSSYQNLRQSSRPDSSRIKSLETVSLKWINLQWPPTATIPAGGSFVTYFQCYEAGVTEPAGPGTGITAWVGYSSSNTPPNTWNNWIPAGFNVQSNNNDEFKASFGSSLSTGIYYFASRFQYNGGSFQYGGYNPGGGGPWDGVTNVSGVLSVGKTLATVTIGNTVQAYDGKSKQVTVVTQPAGLTVTVKYNGSSALPLNAGSYNVVATISDAGYQGSQTSILTIYSVPADASSIALRNRFIWVMYDQVYNQNDLTEALSFNPDVVERAWFKWGNWGNFDYGTWNWMAVQANQKNSLFGGGGTMQALYPGEVDDAKFLRIVERTPYNKPMFFGGDTTVGYYFGDIQKKEYLDFLLGWLYKQIKAGASTFHLDGISVGPTIGTGYSDFSMSEFDSFLIRKYVTSLAWTLNDSRWKSVFDIDLSLDCTNGTISTFDYRKYLKRNNYIANPEAFAFPLLSEWGVPWNYLNTYSGERNKKACDYLYSSLKHFGDSIGKPVFVTMNGYSDNVDYQTTGVWDKWKVVGGKLDIEPNYIPFWRSLKEYNLVHLNKDIPLIVFHDWGNGMPFLSEINESDRILWLKVYAPEVFAAGGIFAWPVSGGGVNYRPTIALKDTISKLSGWYSRNRNIFLNTVWNPKPGVNLKGQPKIENTVQDQYGSTGDTLKKMVHLINKNIDASRKLVVRNNFSIRVFSHKKPRSVWSVSPDFQDARLLSFITSADSVDITVNKLEAYTIVVLDYSQKVPQTIHFNSLTTHQTGDLDFDPGAYSSSGLTVTYKSDNSNVATIVNGKIHIVGKGVCQITASQAGNTYYEAAADVINPFSVNVVAVHDEKIDSSYKIFPNPCTSVIYIERPGKSPVHVQIFSMLGQKQIDKIIDGNELDIHNLSQGMYIIRIDDFTGYIVKK
jgi:hypothetical protein